MKKKLEKDKIISVYEKTEKLHESYRCFNFIPIILINPNDCISFSHDYFPNYLFSNVWRVKESIIRDSWGIMFLFKFNEVSSAHPKVIYMPSFEDISEILSVKKSFKSSLTVNNIDPKTSMNISHGFKSLPKRFTLMYFNISLKICCFEQRWNSDTVVRLGVRLIGDSKKVKKNIFKVENGNDHFWLNILDKDTMNFFNNHGHDNKWKFAFFHYTFKSNIRSRMGWRKRRLFWRV